MIVKIRSAFTQDCWYSEMIGESFIVYALQGSPYLFINETMFIFPQDITSPSGVVNINFSLFNNKAVA